MLACDIAEMPCNLDSMLMRGNYRDASTGKLKFKALAHAKLFVESDDLNQTAMTTYKTYTW